MNVIYKNQAGKRVPRVSTILGVLNKPALPTWANKLGLNDGLTIDEYVDPLKIIGSAVHAAIKNDLLGLPADSAFSELGPSDKTRAENSYLSFCEWRRHHTIRPIALEHSLVSESLGYGGTFDHLGFVDDVLEVTEFKSGDIWPEHFIQLAAYDYLIGESKLAPSPIIRYRVLSVPRTNTESFTEKIKTSIRVEWDIFMHCLDIYNLQKELKHA